MSQPPRHLPDEEADALLTALIDLRAQPNVSFVTTYAEGLKALIVRSADKASGLSEPQPYLVIDVPRLNCITVGRAIVFAKILAQSPLDADPDAFSDRRGTITLTFQPQEL